MHPVRQLHPFVAFLLVVWLSGTLFSSFAQDRLDQASPPNQAWLGVVMGTPRGPAPTDPETGAELTGVPIRYVVDGGPAAEAGLRARDVITSVDGRPVTSTDDLLSALGEQAPGDWIPFQIARRGDERDFRIELSERPESLRGVKMVRGWVGLQLIDLPPELREHFGAPTDAGAMVAGVTQASPAEAAGFRLGDVLYEVEGLPVGSSKMFQQEVTGLGVGNEIEFAVMRDGVAIVLEALLEKYPANRPEGSDER